MDENNCLPIRSAVTAETSNDLSRSLTTLGQRAGELVPAAGLYLEWIQLIWDRFIMAFRQGFAEPESWGFDPPSSYPPRLFQHSRSSRALELLPWTVLPKVREPSCHRPIRHSETGARIARGEVTYRSNSIRSCASGRSALATCLSTACERSKLVLTPAREFVQDKLLQ